MIGLDESSWAVDFCERHEGDGWITLAMIDKHEPSGHDERLFRLLLAPGNAAVTDGLDAIAGPGVNHAVAGPRDA